MRFIKRSPADGHLDSSAIVLLPGWASDYRLFDRCPIGRTSIVPVDPITHDFSDELAAFLSAEGISIVDVYGWSLGGVLALRFARQFPEMVGRVIVAGVRPQYPPAELDEVRRNVEADRQAFMGDFYRRCFVPGQREDYRWFKDALLPNYLAQFSTIDLLRGLDCLAESTFSDADLSLRPTTIIHGALDIIAPAAAIVDVVGRMTDVDFHLVPGAAHAVFMSPKGRDLWPYE